MVKRLWESYQEWYLDYIGYAKWNTKDDLAYFREKLFVSILLLTGILGVLSYVPSFILSILRDELFVIYINTFAILVLLIVTFCKKMTLMLRIKIFSANIFILSFLIFLFLGFGGNGTTLLIVLNIMITLYSGGASGLKAVLINSIFYAILLFCLYFDLVYLPNLSVYGFEVVLVVLVNNLLFNLLIVFAVSFLINHLHRALLKENKLQLELIEKHKSVLKEKDRAELSDKLKTAFLANMSHEIKTPMYGILGCAEFLKEFNKDEKDYLKYIDVIESNGKELLEVVSDIIETSKIDVGLISAIPKTFNINDTINKVCNSFYSLAKEKGVLFINDNNYIKQNNAIIKSDEDKLSSILKHLIKNAIKYTNKGGRVTLKCISSDSDYVEFYVEDTGIGIPKGCFETIFHPFYQVDIQNKKALHGAGIGLSIAKAYTEMLGGELSVVSKEGVGSVFWFAIKTNLSEKLD